VNFFVWEKMGSIRDYLILIRIPNLFTTPSNVIVGFSQLVLLNYANWPTLLILILTSLLLYTAGIVLNDYVDRQIDRRERPTRPLPSGRISTRSALIIVVVATLSSVLAAAYVSPFTLIIVLTIIGTIIAYDCWFKSSTFGHIVMALSRVFNIVLGFSPLLLPHFSNDNDLIRIAVILASIFIYVFTISYLSKFETGAPTKKINYTFVMLPISSIAVVLVLFTITGYFKLDLLFTLPIFIGMLLITFGKKYLRLGANEAGQVVRNLVLSIIILDSLFVSGSIGLGYGLSLLLFLIPAIILSKRFYVT
jgi:4-hydroxybenzoate polyprenyltransferase